MTYVAAFRCDSGIVMCADTLETRKDTKNYVEKLDIPDDNSRPFAIGGAGADDIIRPFTQEIMERIEHSPPTSGDDLKTRIKDAITEVFEKDVPFLALKKQHRAPQFLIGARCSNGQFCIFTVIGRRVYKDCDRVIIGYPTAYNFALLKRYHSESMSMSRAVLLATFLVAQSKKYDEGVGGETRIVVITQTGAWMEKPDFVKADEKRFADFRDIVDRLLLASPDLSITEAQFDRVMDTFRGDIRKMRDDYKRDLVHRHFMAMKEPGYRGDPYANVPLGTSIGYDTEEDMKSGNKAAMKVLEPDWCERKRKLYGPVLWFSVRQCLTQLAGSLSKPDDWVLAVEVEDWSMSTYRFNDPVRLTRLECDQDTYEIKCEGPNLSIRYTLATMMEAAGLPTIQYRDNDDFVLPAEIAAKAIAAIMPSDSQTSMDRQ